MNTVQIQENLKTRWLGSRLHQLPEVDSTNRWAIRMIDQKSGRGEVFLADFQTQGQGRHQRIWESPVGKNILVSFIDSAPRDEGQTPQLNLVAGVAFFEALHSLNQIPGLQLKWPNDLMVNQKKMGGILAEKHSQHPFVVIGFGLNVNTDLTDFPPSLQPLATSIKVITGKESKRETILAHCLNAYEKWREIFDQEGLKPIITFWKNHSNLIGKKVEVVEEEESYTGTAVDLDENGFLVVETKSGKKTVLSGDVTLCS